jgi:hypothetical protein
VQLAPFRLSRHSSVSHQVKSPHRPQCSCAERSRPGPRSRHRESFCAPILWAPLSFSDVVSSIHIARKRLRSASMRNRRRRIVRIHDWLRELHTSVRTLRVMGEEYRSPCGTWTPMICEGRAARGASSTYDRSQGLSNSLGLMLRDLRRVSYLLSHTQKGQGQHVESSSFLPQMLEAQEKRVWHDSATLDESRLYYSTDHGSTRLQSDQKIPETTRVTVQRRTGCKVKAAMATAK